MTPMNPLEGNCSFGCFPCTLHILRGGDWCELNLRFQKQLGQVVVTVGPSSGLWVTDVFITHLSSCESADDFREVLPCQSLERVEVKNISVSKPPSSIPCIKELPVSPLHVEQVRELLRGASQVWWLLMFYNAWWFLLIQFQANTMDDAHAL